MNKELLQQALDALMDSVDLVAGAHAEAVELYGGYPSRQARIARLKRELDAHEAAIFALITAIAQPVQPEQEKEQEKEQDALEVLAEEGWMWDGDQWQRPAQPVQPASKEVVK